MAAQVHLRSSGEFRKVYTCGRRYEGYLMTAFVIPNGSKQHRLGVTASRKAIGNSVERNRSKRLLRESFRLNSESLSSLNVGYDWVLNARRSLLRVKSGKSIEEFRSIVSRIASDEQRDLLKEGS